MVSPPPRHSVQPTPCAVGRQSWSFKGCGEVSDILFHRYLRSHLIWPLAARPKIGTIMKLSFFPSPPPHPLQFALAGFAECDIVPQTVKDWTCSSVILPCSSSGRRICKVSFSFHPTLPPTPTWDSALPAKHKIQIVWQCKDQGLEGAFQCGHLTFSPRLYMLVLHTSLDSSMLLHISLFPCSIFVLSDEKPLLMSALSLQLEY